MIFNYLSTQQTGDLMSTFKNITITKKANIYFDGAVTSRTVQFEDGTKKTLGIMMPGEYNFDTDAAEIMELLGGKMDVLLAGETDWKTYVEGESFQVPANSSFKLHVPVVADYCCSYIQ